MGHEEMQQVEFGGPHAQSLSRAHDGARGRIELEAFNAHRIRGQLRRAPAQQRLDACFQLARREGLGDVVIRPNGEAHELVNLLGLGREHDDGDPRRLRV